MRSLLLVAVLSVVAIGVNSDMCGSHADGCSIPLNLPFFYKGTFRSACDHHDICYGCGALYGVSQKSCDEAFLDDMYSACSSKRRRASDKKRSICTWTARNVYYSAVRSFGNKYYLSAANHESYCSNLSLVRACMPQTGK